MVHYRTKPYLNTYRTIPYITILPNYNQSWNISELYPISKQYQTLPYLKKISEVFFHIALDQNTFGRREKNRKRHN